MVLYFVESQRYNIDFIQFFLTGVFRNVTNIQAGMT